MCLTPFGGRGSFIVYVCVCRLQQDHEQCKSNLTAALKTERKATSDLAERLEEEKRRHANTHTLLEQVTLAHVRFEQMRLILCCRKTLNWDIIYFCQLDLKSTVSL